MGDGNLRAMGHVEPLCRMQGVSLERRMHCYLHDQRAQEMRGLEAMNWIGSRLETETETQPYGYHIKPHSQRRLHKRLQLHFYMSFGQPHVDNPTEHSISVSAASKL